MFSGRAALHLAAEEKNAAILDFFQDITNDSFKAELNELLNES